MPRDLGRRQRGARRTPKRRFDCNLLLDAVPEKPRRSKAAETAAQCTNADILRDEVI